MFPVLVFHLPLIGTVQLTTYSVAALAAAMAGLLVSRRYFALQGIDPDHVWLAAVFLVPFTAIGAKLIPLSLDPTARQALWQTLDSPRAAAGVIAALTMPGGSLLSAWSSGLIGALVYARVFRLPVGPCLDGSAPAIAVALPVMRMGCLAAGCCYGTPTDLPWGIRYTVPAVGASTGVPLGIALHPTPLYEAALVAALALLIVGRWHTLRPGQPMALLFGGYGVIRFLTEFVRGDAQIGWRPYGLTVTQWLCLAMFLVAASIWWASVTRRRTT